MRLRSAAAPVVGLDHQAPAVRGVDKVDHLVLGVRFDGIRDQDIDAVELQRFFFVFQLIQSQAQFGPASAEAFEDNAQRFAGMFGQDRFQKLCGFVGNLHGSPFA